MKLRGSISSRRALGVPSYSLMNSQSGFRDTEFHIKIFWFSSPDPTSSSSQVGSDQRELLLCFGSSVMEFAPQGDPSSPILMHLLEVHEGQAM